MALDNHIAPLPKVSIVALRNLLVSCACAGAPYIPKEVARGNNLSLVMEKSIMLSAPAFKSRFIDTIPFSIYAALVSILGEVVINFDIS